MQTIQREFNLYSFSELDESAKMQAAQGFFEALYPEYIRDETDYYNAEHFTNSEAKWEWAFNSCQGDGANVYGQIAYNDLAKLANIPQLRYMEGERLEFAPNRRYTYCTWSENWSNYWEIAEALENHGCKLDIAREWAKTICEAVEALCTKLEKYGYDLVFDAYENPEYYEGQLFDEGGAFACHEWDLPKTPEKPGEGGLDDLTPEQIEELSQNALCEIFQALDYDVMPSYGELASATEIISPGLLQIMFGDTSFSRDDFFLHRRDNGNP